MSATIQRRFSGGELSPSLHAGADLVKYATGAKRIRNNIVMKHGGTISRGGSVFTCELKDSTTETRMRTLPFYFSNDQTYVLEFGPLYMRVVRLGAQVLVSTAKNITAITKANPGVVTSAAHGYSNGDDIFLESIGGMTELNNRTVRVANKTTNTYELVDLAGNNIDTSNYTTYTNSGTSTKVYEIETPYAAADLADLHFSQSADVITITHPNYAQRDLSRTGHASWSLDVIEFETGVTRPTNGAATGGTAGANSFWQVTAIDFNTGEESLVGLGTGFTITGISKANPAVVTTTAGANPWLGFDYCFIGGVVGMTEVNNKVFQVHPLTANTFQLVGIDSTNFTAYSSGGTANKAAIAFGATIADSSNPVTIAWTSSPNALEYNVYKCLNGIFGYIGSATGNFFLDNGYVPDILDTPPQYRNPFSTPDDYPSTVAYIQQRQTFANSTNSPEGAFASKTGLRKNFTIKTPVTDDGSVTFQLAGNQINRIRHILDLGRIVVLTESAEFTVEGNAAGILTPTAVNPKQQSANGSSNLQPVKLDTNALYVQARGSIIRDIGFDFQGDGYRGNDLTIFASHLFEGYTIVDWAYQKTPHSIVWVVRDDGVMLGLTYIREQQIWAWHWHDTDGVIENVCVVPEGNEDALYVVVKREIAGLTTSRRYLERFSNRFIGPDSDAIKDFIGMDCALSYDGRNDDDTHQMKLADGTTWEYNETIHLNSSAAYFSADDVGNQIHLTGPNGDLIRFKITSYISPIQVNGRPHKTIPASMRGLWISDWAAAVNVVSGLSHLEGMDVSIFADAFVVGSPNNPKVETYTVTNGSVTLDKPYAVIHVGLPYLPDLELLDIETVQSETMSNKKVKVDNVTLRLEKTRGVWVGGEAPTDDAVDPLEGLTELKLRQSETMDEPVALFTGKKNVRIEARWKSNGSVFMRQIDPVPMSVLAVTPDGIFPVASGGL